MIAEMGWDQYVAHYSKEEHDYSSENSALLHDGGDCDSDDQEEGEEEFEEHGDDDLDLEKYLKWRE